MSIHLSSNLVALAAGLLPGAAAAPLDPAAPTAQEGGSAPPGLVLVEGGRVQVGTERDRAEELALANEDMAKFFVGETPRHTVRVDDFYLMVTEVTNEQYAAFVSATDGRPPYTWGAKAIEEARMAFLEEQNEKRQKAREEGNRYQSEKFEPEAWWEDHWQDAEWSVPEDIALEPVTYVAYEDALGYARWAGLRLMSEEEFVCAGRGTGEDRYSWGDEWDPKKVAGLDMGRDHPWPVASFPEGSREGIHDLLGNVWEWTSSPYAPFEGYEPMELEIGRGRDREEWTPLPPFDPNDRVVVGGSVHLNKLGLRLNTRMPAARFQRTNAIGFRCAASLRPGADVADLAVNHLIPGTAKPVETGYDLRLPTVLHRWEHEVPGAAEQGDAAAASEATSSSRPEGYAVITAYDAMCFVPTTEINAVRETGLAQLTEEGPAHFGIFYTTKSILEPALEPGAYLFAYRAGEELRELPEGAEPPAWRTLEGYDPETSSYLIFDVEDGAAVPIAAWAVPKSAEPLYTTMKEGTAKLQPWVPPDPETLEEGAPPPTPIDTVRFDVYAQGRQRRKGYKFTLPFRVEPGTVGESWHSR